MSTPPLGWIAPQDRTKEQEQAHVNAMAGVRRNMGLPDVQLAKGDKIDLTQSWKHPDVIADIGFEFTGFYQWTGACVGVSAGNWVGTLSFLQRLLNQTVAFVPFWPYFYGRTRANEGDRGQGEGAVDSVMGETIAKDGYFAATEPGLPQFSREDGLRLTKSLEFTWSDGNSSTVTKWLETGRKHIGARATLNSVQDIKNAIANGYPVIDGCEYYVGNGSIASGGGTPYVTGHYDGRGGHSTCILGVWEHPNDGTLYLYSNQWPGSTYPTDPAGAGRCCVWITEKEMAKLFSYGGSGGETMALSHVDWFPVQQPKVQEVLSWLI